MEVWILFSEEIEAPTAEAYEVRRFMSVGREMGVTVKVYSPAQFDLMVTNEDRSSVMINGEAVPLPDFLLPRTPPVENGYFSLAVIRQLERLGVKVYNGSTSIEAVADKMHTHQILAEHDLPTPVTMLAKFPVDYKLVEKHIGFPVVVKTLLGVNGTGVFLIENQNAFHDLMNLIKETNPNIQLIFQKFVAVSKGRDLRVFIVDGEVLACMERRAKEGDFKANYSQGGSVRKYDLDEDTRKLALKTAEVLGLQVAGIDLLFKEEGGFTICEANTFPGFKGLEQACGVNVPEAIFKSMQRDLKRGHMRVDSTTIAPKQKRSGWKLILTGIRHLVDGVFGKIKGAVAQS